jgi:hypothetical protein
MTPLSRRLAAAGIAAVIAAPAPAAAQVVRLAGDMKVSPVSFSAPSAISIMPSFGAVPALSAGLNASLAAPSIALAAPAPALSPALAAAAVPVASAAPAAPAAAAAPVAVAPALPDAARPAPAAEGAKPETSEAAKSAADRAFDGSEEMPLEDRVKFKITTPDMTFSSDEAIRNARKLGLLAAKNSPAPTKTATDAQVELVRAAIAGVAQAFPNTLRWLRFKTEPVEPEIPARKIAALIGGAIARPDEVAGPLVPLLPRFRRSVAAGSWVMKGARFFGIDFGLGKKGDAAAKSAEAELLDFIAGFEDVLPIAIGGFVTSVNMGKANGVEFDPREAVPRATAAGVLKLLGLKAARPEQAKILDAELAAAYARLFAEIASFMTLRRGDATESFAQLLNALADDLPAALKRFGRTAAAVRRAGN